MKDNRIIRADKNVSPNLACLAVLAIVSEKVRSITIVPIRNSRILNELRQIVTCGILVVRH